MIELNLNEMYYNKMYIHCDSEEKAQAAINELYALGAEWRVSLPTTTNWKQYKENTVYSLDKEGSTFYILYGSTTNHDHENIVEFEEILGLDLEEPENSEPLQIDRMKLLKDLL